MSSSFREEDFYDESDFEGYGERDADTRNALKCMEEALTMLACCGKSKAIQEIMELINRAYGLVDRHYGVDYIQEYTIELQFDPREVGIEPDEDEDDD